MTARPISGWINWYRFASETLGYQHDEAVAYANLRSVEKTTAPSSAGRDLDQRLHLRSSERDRSRVVQGTFEQEGEIARSCGATGSGRCGISQ